MTLFNSAQVEQILLPNVRDLGDGFQVRRALPSAQRRMVGPFIFLDSFGPVTLRAGEGLDSRPHPHIGLSTLTYLIDGEIVHRDSEGYVQTISPGEVNLMTAGRGIVHSERSGDLVRASGRAVFARTSWSCSSRARRSCCAHRVPPVSWCSAESRSANNAISTGILSPAARNASRTPRETGVTAAFPACRVRPNSLLFPTPASSGRRDCHRSNRRRRDQNLIPPQHQQRNRIMTYAIIGSGAIGTALATQFARNDIDVPVANSRGPASLADLVGRLGTNIKAASVQEALKADIVILAVPFGSVPETVHNAAAWNGRIIVDATNAIDFPAFTPKDLGGRLSTDVFADFVPGARVVKAFNTLPAAVLASDPAKDGGHRVVFLSGNDAAANADVATLIKRLGFSGIDLGKLADGRLAQLCGPLMVHNLIKQD